MNGFQFSPNSTIPNATLSFLAPSTSGNYEVRLYSQNNSSSPSATAPFTVQAQTLPGDLPGDRIVNSIDFSIMNGVWLTNNAAADLNHDGTVNSLDFSTMNGNWLKAI